tara:strand:- start:212 stop:343 length:132 start_codon:yes stop_codon:yes gene_type:complete
VGLKAGLMGAVASGLTSGISAGGSGNGFSAGASNTGFWFSFSI